MQPNITQNDVGQLRRKEGDVEPTQCEIAYVSSLVHPMSTVYYPLVRFHADGLSHVLIHVLIYYLVLSCLGFGRGTS